MSATRAAPRLTLGRPVDNCERFIAEPLDALVAQGHTAFELIIADDGSADGTAEIDHKFGYP
jgi:glycosyltransferase involved in cell wall biosynthesis